MKDFDSKLNTFFNQLDDRLQTWFPNVLAETAVEVFKDSFTSKSFDGVPWKPYGNPKREPKRGSLMRRTNNLVNSIRPTIISSAQVTISAGSSKVKYARVHNEGLRVRTVQYVKPHHNNNFMGTGRRLQIQGHARKIDYTMPRRQFMGKSQTLLNTLKNRFENEFKIK